MSHRKYKTLMHHDESKRHDIRCKEYDSFLCGFCPGTIERQISCDVVAKKKTVVDKIFPAKQETFGVKKLVNDHWSYVSDLLKTHEIDTELIETIGWHYRTAMEHGYKHGVEDANRKEHDV